MNTWFQSVQLPPKEKQAETILEVRDLSFAYTEGQPVLQDVAFKIQKGEMLSIVGKNGAGKSTLSNLVCGFLTPAKGAILRMARI